MQLSVTFSKAVRRVMEHNEELTRDLKEINHVLHELEYEASKGEKRKRFICSKCQKQLSSAQNLRLHEKTHAHTHNITYGGRHAA